MIGRKDQFIDSTQKYYPKIGIKSFYEHLDQDDRMAKLLLGSKTHNSLKQKKRLTDITFVGIGVASLFLSVLMFKLPFGLKFMPVPQKLLLTTVVTISPIYFFRNQINDPLIKLKEQIFEQKKYDYKSYILTGDLQQVNKGVMLCQK